MGISDRAGRNDYSGGGGAFHSHTSLRDLKKVADDASIDGSGGNKLRGLDTEAARELSQSRRSLGGSARCGRSDIFDDNLGAAIPDGRPRSRRSLLGGVSYGAASVKRVGLDEDSSETGTTSIDPAAPGGSVRSSGRAASISAGEGAWLVNSNGRRTSSRGSIVTLERKDSDDFTPDAEQPPSPAVAKATGTNTDRKVQFAGKSDAAKSSPAPSENNGKAVQFSTVSVRYYQITLGTNPFVTSGPPLELAWEHDAGASETNIPLDRYESVRAPRRRSEWDLALSRGERESRLLEMGCTRQEIAAAVRETSRIKAQRANTVLNLRMEPVEEFTSGVSRRCAKMVGLRKDSSWMYREWKNGGSRSAAHPNFSVMRSNAIVQQERRREATESSGEVLSPEEEEGGTFVRKLMHRPVSPLKEREATEEERPESPRKVYTGPAFGITHKSLSTRFGLGDKGDTNDNRASFHSRGGESSGALWPFALVKMVFPESPASEAELRRGDRIIKLGNITALNHDRCMAIPELGQVAAAKECSIPMLVEDEAGIRRDVIIRPHSWSGRGHFGFLFRELGTEMEMEGRE